MQISALLAASRCLIVITINMKKLSLVFYLLLLLCSCQEEIKTGSVYGVVTNYETGEAIKNASVSLLSSRHKSVITGSDGYYEFRDLESGRYEIEVQADGYYNDKKTIYIVPATFEPYDIVLTPIRPVLDVSPDMLDFGSDSKTLSFEIVNDGEGILEWTISEDSDWLTCEPMSGKTGKDISSVVVTVSREGLEKERYSDNITISSNGGSKTIKVNLDVIPEIPVLEVSTTKLEFTTESTLAFDITNAGTGVLEWSLNEESDWFSCEPLSGATATKPSSVIVTVSRNGLEKGVYSESIVVSSNGGSRVVMVKMTIDPVELKITPEELDFGTVNSSLDITLRNNSAKSVKYEVKTANRWLAVSKNSGTVTHTDKFSAIVSRQGLSAGTYDSEIMISSDMGTVSIPVRMAVAMNEIPVVTAESIDGITYNSAVLHGTVVSVGSSAISRHGFCWSESPNPTINDNVTNLGDCSSPVAFESTVVNLKNETKYYCRSYAENDTGISYSDKVLTFTTDALPKEPTVQTGKVTNLEVSSAEVDGTILSTGGCKVTSYGHVWSKHPNPVIGNASSSDFAEAITPLTYKSRLENLAPGTEYYVRSYATNEKGTSYGNEESFTTLKGDVVLRTSTITDIIHNSALGGGEIVQDNGNVIIETGVCWSTSETPDINDYTVQSDNFDGNVFTCRMTGLNALTSYYARAYIKTDGGTVFYGEPSRFTTTKEMKLPKLSSVQVSSIQTTTAMLTATVESEIDVIECGFCWAIADNPTVNDSKKLCDPSSAQMGIQLTELADGTTYYVRAFARNSVGIAYSEQVDFSTLAITVPSLSDVEVWNITTSGASASSFVTSDGNSEIIESGLCWSDMTPVPTVNDEVFTSADNIIEVETNLVGLRDNTTYYIRAYAKNSKGIGYSDNVVSFTTLEIILPIVCNFSVRDIGRTSAYVSADVYNGNGRLEDYGVCWSLNSLPTVSDNKISMMNEYVVVTPTPVIKTRETAILPPDESFDAKINGLPPMATIYARGYAVNEKGISYSDEIVFNMVDVDIDIWNGAVAAKFGGGSGTKADPIIINEASQLALLAQNVNSGISYSGVYFKMTSNLRMSRIPWISIGNQENSFAGTFDGGNNIISEIYVRSSSDYKGLFGNNSGVIENLTIEGCVSGNNYVGGLCGINKGTLRCITNQVNVDGNIFVGGIAGASDAFLGSISYSTNNAPKISGFERVGGICGYIELKSDNNTSVYPIRSCQNMGVVSGTASVGGIVGYVHVEETLNSLYSSPALDCYINNNSNNATIFGTYSGGIVGYIYADSSHYYKDNDGRAFVYVANCCNTADCGDGGLVGYMDARYYSPNSKYYNYSRCIDADSYWLYDISNNIGNEVSVGNETDNSNWFYHTSSGCYMKDTEEDVVERLNAWVSDPSNSDFVYRHWKYETIDGYACPVLE